MAKILPHAGLAVVTGASTGIGFELAKIAASKGYDLIVVADTPVEAAAHDLRNLGAEVTTLRADLATCEGVDSLIEIVGGRDVDLLFANAGHGLGGGFLDQEFSQARHVLDTNITGTIYLLHSLARRMRRRGEGRILVTGSIAGFQPGSFQAVYNGTKAFIDSFTLALREELRDTGVSVSCLMPGATDTNFFARAGMMDTKIGASEKKADPAQVARIGFDAMMRGEADVVAGFSNKVDVAISNLTPGARLARQHRKLAEPGSALK
jgi:short-subunit dehydrogenase